MKKQFDIYVPMFRVLNGLVSGKSECTEKEFLGSLIDCNKIHDVKVIHPESKTINLKTYEQMD